MTGFRLASGGRIDRNNPVRFQWDGRTLDGFRGDTIASALLASGERIVGRSFKYHRPRGVYSAGVEEPNAYVTLGAGAHATANAKATATELQDGMRVSGQNAWPSVRLDLGSAAGVFSPFLPAGFYYKTFIGPFRGTGFWMACERFIRRAAGMGRASRKPDPDHYERANAFCDVLVVGTGPAGLAAAETAAMAGLDVILVEQDFVPGGSLLFESSTIEGAPSDDWLTGRLSFLNACSGVRVMPRTTAFGLYDGDVAGLIERPPESGDGAEHEVRGRFWVVRARCTLLATGAIERGFAFHNNDLPGIMTASAIRAYAGRFGVGCGRHVVLATNNDSAHDVARDLIRTGIRVTVADSRNEAHPTGVEGCEVLRGCVLQRAEGRRGVRGAVVAPVTGGPARRIPCDAIGVSGGWNPAVHLACHRGVKPEWDEALGGFVAPGGLDGIEVAGAARGIWDADTASRSGRAAASRAARRLGMAVDAPPMPEAGGWQAPLRPLYEVQVSGRRGSKSFVDLQNDVSAADIRLSAAEGYFEAEHVKRYTTLGMSPDQGKTSNVVGLGILAAARGIPLPDCGTTGFRPPYDPVEIGALAGRSRGRSFRPVRRVPAHAWHYRNAAVMIEAGVWRRPQFYPRQGEGLEEAYVREASVARERVGLADVSSLGKIAVQGPDAGRFLDHVYVNLFSTLPIGRARYGIMLRDDGIVLDDGTTWRVGPQDWFMTTTTAQATRVMAWMEGLLATRFQGLRVHLTSVTDQWSGVSLAGPRSRAVLEAVIDGVDLSDDGFPFMGVREGHLRAADGRMHCRIARISFSGELGYEVYVGSDYAEASMEALQSAVENEGGALYGLEALGTLRIEKGHVTAAELDGRVTLGDAGLARMASRKKPFIGKTLASRPELLNEARPQLVGIFPANRAETFHSGAILCETGGVRGHGVGWITAVTHSPALGHWIGLGFATGGARHDEVRTLVATDPVRNKDTRVEIVSPHMFDPRGERLRG